VPLEEREALLRRILWGAPEAGKDPHVSRVLAIIDALAGRDRS